MASKFLQQVTKPQAKLNLFNKSAPAPQPVARPSAPVSSHAFNWQTQRALAKAQAKKSKR
jgi:hypothetical protein